MPYKITIERLTETTKIVHGDWVTLDTEEVGRSQFSTDEHPSRVKDVYGYAPDVEETFTEKRDLLIQEVDEMDLAKVIRAINGMDS